MKDSENSIKEPWYWFILSVFGCNEASAIRCFLAPVYIAYINSNNNPFIDGQKEWIEYYEEKVSTIIPETRNRITADSSIKNRIKIIGEYLCYTVEKEKKIECYRYFGKNRNVSCFPERFINSIFPFETEKGIFDELWSYYYQLIRQVFSSDTDKVNGVLKNLEMINKEHFNVPAITSESKDEILIKIDRISHLLCSFCVLSASLKIGDKKKSESQSQGHPPLYLKAKKFLEIDYLPSEPPIATSLKISLDDLIHLNIGAIESRNLMLIELIGKINSKNIDTILWANNLQIKEIIDKSKEAERQIIGMMNSQNYEISRGISELHIINKIETFWIEVTEGIKKRN